jgi:hypothetical protein
MHTPGPCECKVVDYDDPRDARTEPPIDYCPTHAAAPEMLAALQRIDAALERLINTIGWDAPWDNITGGIWAGPHVHEAQDAARAMLRAVEG